MSFIDELASPLKQERLETVFLIENNLRTYDLFYKEIGRCEFNQSGAMVESIYCQ